MDMVPILILCGMFAYGLGQWLPPERSPDAGLWSMPMSGLTEYQYRKARWQELHYGGPKAYRRSQLIKTHRVPHPKYGTKAVKEYSDGTFSVEFR